MLSPSGFKLYSLAFGSNYVRTFVIHDVRGLIADYVLGECGASESPIPANFFTKVSMADGAVQITNNDQTHLFSVTRDRVVFLQRTPSSSADFEEADIVSVRTIAKHLVVGALKFLHEPNLVFFGTVWDYVKVSTKRRRRWEHPAATDLAKRMLKMEFDDSMEIPAEVTTRVAFRRRLQESAVQKDRDDYINAILLVRDEKLSTLWHKEDNHADDVSDEQPRAAAISMDVQRFFDPRRRLDQRMFDTHWNYCLQSISPRLSSLLREFKFGSEAHK
ncbi:MAG: hypothetical protein IID43_02925 [Planctomycetes bacterium]|nr:hypothetical protein [Planctomycetota bacterium]